MSLNFQKFIVSNRDWDNTVLLRNEETSEVYACALSRAYQSTRVSKMVDSIPWIEIEEFVTRTICLNFVLLITQNSLCDLFSH